VLMVCTNTVLKISVRNESQNRNLSILTLLGKANLAREGVGQLTALSVDLFAVKSRHISTHSQP
jgi:hypothetical protein